MAEGPTLLAIPPFRDDGYLPEGLYVGSETEIFSRFGSSNRTRRRLAMRLRRWIELGKSIGAKRLLVDGSFVTAREDPYDVDTVISLPQDFAKQVDQELTPALELEEMLLTRRPEEIFAAEDENDWQEWVNFFSQTREPDGRRKGLVEIRL
ncbi:MAG: hypothetical protein ABIP88_14060 [Candidatus Binatia bacterium]